MIIEYQGLLCPINQKYINRTYNLSPRYRNAKETIQDIFKIKRKGQYFSQEQHPEIKIALDTTYPRKHDIDAFIKVILDSGNKVLYDDDSQVKELVVRKSKGECGFKINISPISLEE